MFLLMNVSSLDFSEESSKVVGDKTMVAEGIDGSVTGLSTMVEGDFSVGANIDGSGSSTIQISFWLSSWP